MIGAFVLSCACLASADEPKPQPPTESRRMVTDPRWFPRAGEKGDVIAENAPGCVTFYAYSEFKKFRTAKDQAGVDAMIANREAAPLSRGTPILVVKRHRPEPIYPRTMTGSQMQSAIQSAILTPEGIWPLEVRILDGPFKGQIRFCNESDIGRLMPEPEPEPPAKPKEPPKPVDPGIRAATMLRSAKGLETSGKIPGAITLYGQVVKTFPRSPQAKEAEARLKALKR